MILFHDCWVGVAETCFSIAIHKRMSADNRRGIPSDATLMAYHGTRRIAPGTRQWHQGTAGRSLLQLQQ